ncbi:MAG TPA: hypothetical protein PKE04_03195 [Clostridia bacterium]|nr:hypothetical protein [Clostridia bacterium]
MTFQEGAPVFVSGAIGYSALELLFRRRTHWTMALTGGGCLLALYAWNKRLERRRWPVKCLVGSLTITAAELVVGLIVNRLLRWGVWDYSNRRIHLLGQICPAYSFLWFLLSIPAYGLCAAFRHGYERGFRLIGR